MVLAGGTSVNASESSQPVEMIDLQALGFDEIGAEGSVLNVGAMARLSALATHPGVPELLRELALREEPNTLRNAATVGGTLAIGNPDSELLAGFLVFEGQVTLAKDGGATARVDLSELLADRSVLEGSVIVALKLQTDGVAAAARTGRTPSDTSIVAAAGRRAEGGIRLAVTGMATTPVLVEPEAVGGLNPSGDFRGSSEYRRHLAQTLTRRVMEQLGEQS
jgi:CO/xanthine dehydrogenase FAD-binding subunit